VTSEEEAMQRLQSSLPRQVVLDGARAMQEFTNRFKAHMDKIRASSACDPSGSYVVTKAMVDSFVNELKYESRTQ
jgi:hypothetical protein